MSNLKINDDNSYEEELSPDKKLEQKGKELTRSESSVSSQMEYKLYPYRWLIQLSFSLALGSTGIIQVGFSPIAHLITKLYDINHVVVEMQALIFVFISLFGNFLVIHVSKKGLRVTLITGALFIIAGCAARELVQIVGRFDVVTLGTILLSFGQAFFYISSTKLSNLWFGVRERTLSTVLGALSLPMGSIIGFILPSFFISEEDTIFPSVGRKKLGNLIMVQNLIVAFLALFVLVFAKDKPPTPPSNSADRKEVQYHLCEELGKLLKNKNYLLLCMTYTFTHSNHTALGAIVSSLTKPYGYQASENSALGGIYIVSGVIGSFMASTFIDRTQKFKLVTRIITFGALAATAMTFFSLPSGKMGFFGANMCLLGFMQIPLAPVCYAFAVELTYPTSEQISNGIIILPAKLLGTSLGLICSLISQHNPIYSLWIFIGFACISFITANIIQEDLRRLKYALSEAES